MQSSDVSGMAASWMVSNIDHVTFESLKPRQAWTRQRLLLEHGYDALHCWIYAQHVARLHMWCLYWHLAISLAHCLPQLRETPLLLQPGPPFRASGPSLMS